MCMKHENGSHPCPNAEIILVVTAQIGFWDFGPRLDHDSGTGRYNLIYLTSPPTSWVDFRFPVLITEKVAQDAIT